MRKLATFILPTSFDQNDKPCALFLSYLTLIGVIDEYKIKLSWYEAKYHDTNFGPSDLFIRDILRIPELSQIYRSMEMAIVSNLCKDLKTESRSNMIVFIPRTFKPDFNSFSKFSSSGKSITFISDLTYDDKSNRFFTYLDDSWPDKVIQILLGNETKLENQLSKSLVLEDHYVNQGLFWLCGRCMRGTIIWLISLFSTKQ